VKGWIGVDLDGTLAVYDGWRGPEHIGEPVPEMVLRVKAWLAAGEEVRVFTARCHANGRAGLEQSRVIILIEEWCRQHIGVVLPVTNIKDFGMKALWDDRAVRVVANTGQPCCPHSDR